jgi:segregation and condensation protein B
MVTENTSDSEEQGASQQDCDEHDQQLEKQTGAPQVTSSEAEVVANERSEDLVVQPTAEEATQQSLAVAADGGDKKLSESQQTGLLEALLLANGDPLGIAKIQEIAGLTRSEVLAAADRLQTSLTGAERGIELVVVNEKLQLRSKAAYAEHVRQLMAVKPRKLSQAALETLAIVAYQQPIVKSEIDKIRGVDVAPTIKTLLERNLVKIIGYQASVGQPALYGTTDDFLSVFGLSALSALPALNDLKALAKEPGEAEVEAEVEVEDREIQVSEAVAVGGEGGGVVVGADSA